MALSGSLMAIRMQLTGHQQVVAGATQARTAIAGTAEAAAASNAAQAAGARGAAKYGGALRMVGRAAGFAGGALALVGGFVIKDAVQDTQELAKATLATARVTGMQNEASSQWLQLGRQRGIQDQQLNMGMKTFAGNLTKAQDGMETNVDLFERLGIAQDDLKNMSMEDTILATSDALSEMENGAEKTYIQTTLFGRAGLKLFPLMDMGAKKLQETLGKFAPISDKNADDAMKLTEAQRRLTREWDNFQIMLGGKVMPVIADIVKDLGEMFESAKKTGTLKDLKDVFKDLWGTIKDGFGIIDGISKVLGGLDGTIKATMIALLTGKAILAAKAAGRGIGAALGKGIAIGVVVFLPDALEAISPKITDTLYDFFRNSTPLGLIDETFGTDITGTIFGAAGDRAAANEKRLQFLDSQPSQKELDRELGSGDSGKNRRGKSRAKPDMVTPPATRKGASVPGSGGNQVIELHVDGRKMAETVVKHGENKRARR